MPGPGTGGGINLKAGMEDYELCIMYKDHRRNESSKSWRNRYTPRWKRFLTDGPLKTWESTRVDRLTAISQRGHERAGLSEPHTIPSSQRDLVNMRAYIQPFSRKSRVKEDLSPSRASATILNVALVAQHNYTQASHNSGGGRTEEKRDRINQQQIDRSRNSNWTQAGGTEITGGTTSAYGWTTLPAEKQVAAIEMRAGQTDGPLPFEASFEFDDTIINRALATAKRWIRRTRCTTKGVFCNKAYVILKSWNILLDEEIFFLEEIIFLGK